MNYSQRLSAALNGDSDKPFVVIAMDGEKNGYTVDRYNMERPYVVILKQGGLCVTKSGKPRRFGDVEAAYKFAEKQINNKEQSCKHESS